MSPSYDEIPHGLAKLCSIEHCCILIFPRKMLTIAAILECSGEHHVRHCQESSRRTETNGSGNTEGEVWLSFVADSNPDFIIFISCKHNIASR